MKRIRTGIIGVGFIGAVHIEQLRRLGNVDVVAICEAVNAEKKAQANFIPAFYSDYKTMINNENLDCIHICTPNNTHFDIAMYAMERGVHVVCEKPMTCTAEEACILCEKAKEKGVIHAMNFNCRFYPIAYQMREMVKAGDVGDIQTVHGGYFQDWLFLDTDYSWRLEPEFTGASRAFADIGSHWIDAVEFITGRKAVEVLADFAIFHKTRKKPLRPIDTYSGLTLSADDYQETPIVTEDWATVIFVLDNGGRATCNISQVYAGRKNQMVVSVSGNRCSMHWDTEDSNSLWVGHRNRENGVFSKDPATLAPKTASVISYPGGHVEGFPDSFKQNFRKIYAAIEGGPVEDYATFDDGKREMELSNAIVQSAKERRWVRI